MTQRLKQKYAETKEARSQPQPQQGCSPEAQEGAEETVQARQGNPRAAPLPEAPASRLQGARAPQADAGRVGNDELPAPPDPEDRVEHGRGPVQL